MLDDLIRSAGDATRQSMRGSNESFLQTFIRRFKERLVFSLIITLVSLGIIVIVFLYIAFVIVRAI